MSIPLAGSAPAASAEAGLEDPQLWNQMLAVEAGARALPSLPRPNASMPKPKPRRQRRPEDLQRMLHIVGALVLIPIVLVVAVAAIAVGRNLIASGGMGGWKEFRSEAGRYRVLLPKRLGGRSEGGQNTVFGDITMDFEGVSFRDGSLAAVAWADVPPGIDFDWNAAEMGMRSMSRREVRLGDYRGYEYADQHQGRNRLQRAYFVDNRLYELTWFSARSETLDSPDVQKFFDSFRPLGREDLVPVVAQSSGPLRVPPGWKPAAPPPPSPPLPDDDVGARSTEASGRASLSGSVVVFQVRRFEGRLDPLSAARNALRGIAWADLTRLEYAESTGTLTIGVRGGSVDTGAAKTALEQAGFQIGWTSLRPQS